MSAIVLDTLDFAAKLKAGGSLTSKPKRRHGRLLR